MLCIAQLNSNINCWNLHVSLHQNGKIYQNDIFNISIRKYNIWTILHLNQDLHVSLRIRQNR
jgi:hypothetical protein